MDYARLRDAVGDLAITLESAAKQVETIVPKVHARVLDFIDDLETQRRQDDQDKGPVKSWSSVLPDDEPFTELKEPTLEEKVEFVLAYERDKGWASRQAQINVGVRDYLLSNPDATQRYYANFKAAIEDKGE